MKSLGNFAVLAFFVAITLTLSACGGSHSSPEDLGKAYAEALSNQDKDGYIDCYVEADKAKMREKMKESDDDKKDVKITITFESAKEEKVGDKTYQVVTCKMGPFPMAQVAVEEGGGWLFSSSETEAYQKAKSAESLKGATE